MTCDSISISISIVTTFTGFLYCQFTRPERKLRFQKITLWNLVSKVCGFRSASTPLSRKRKTELQQKFTIGCKKLSCVTAPLTQSSLHNHDMDDFTNRHQSFGFTENVSGDLMSHHVYLHLTKSTIVPSLNPKLICCLEWITEGNEVMNKSTFWVSYTHHLPVTQVCFINVALYSLKEMFPLQEIQTMIMCS